MSILSIGLIGVDCVLQLEKYPEKDDKVRAKNSLWALGGCATNTTIGLKRLGTDAMLLSSIGDDHLGTMIESFLKQENISTEHMFKFGDTSGFSSILVDLETQTRTCIHAKQQFEIDDEFIAQKIDWHVIFEKYDVTHLHLDSRQTVAAISAAHAARKHGGITVSLDIERPRPDIIEVYKCCDYIFTNENYAIRFGKECGGDIRDAANDCWVQYLLSSNTILNQMQELITGMISFLLVAKNCEFVIATRGAKGAIVLAARPDDSSLYVGAGLFLRLPDGDDRRTRWKLKTDMNARIQLAVMEVPAFPIAEKDIIDTTGCGDAFWAGFLHSFKTKKFSHFDALTVAAEVAAKKTRKLGPNAGCVYEKDVEILEKLSPGYASRTS